MPEPQSPKNEVPIRSYPTPNWGEAPVDGISVIDEFLKDYVEPNKPGYVPRKIGSTHPDTVNFPNHRLLREENIREGLNVRYWCNGYRNEDQYNYDINFSGEENSHPIFTRRYLVRRDQYSPQTKEQRFTGIYLITVTDGGSGYDPDIPPTVTISGGGGAGATAQAVVSSAGEVVWVFLTNEGSGYTTQPTVSFGSGTATATAKLQLDTGVVYQINVTDGDSGYVTAPTVTLTGGGGSGATAVAQLDGDAVGAILVTAYGSGYTGAPTVQFSSGSATATALIETATCRLVKEDVQQLGDDDPRRSLYVMVIRTWETFPGPYLIEHRYEKYLNWYVTTRKRMVLGSQVPPDMNYVTRNPGEIIEYSPLSKHRAIQAISQINTGIAWENGGQDVEYTGTANYSFPDEVQEAPIIDVYGATDGSRVDIAFGWRLRVIHGYSGPCSARFVRRYTFDPEDAAFQAALPTITYIKPEAWVLNDGFQYEGGNLIAQATQFNVPATLHPELEVDVESHAAFIVDLDGPVGTMPATIPTTIAAGEEICVSIKPTNYDFGLFVYDIVYVTNPTPPA